MGKYLKKFETQAAYEAAQSGLILPNVSLTVDNNTVHYNPSSPVPPTPSHDYVEIGGIKWATMNVGANSVGDYGNYYQYGKGSAQYAATSGDSDYSGTENPLAASADTATQEWGGNWRTPTQNEFESLKANTVAETIEIDGVVGCKFSDKTDNSKYIFMPYGGYYQLGEDIGGVDGYGEYWTSTPVKSFFIDGEYPNESYFDTTVKSMGINIRPVLDE